MLQQGGDHAADVGLHLGLEGVEQHLVYLQYQQVHLEVLLVQDGLEEVEEVPDLLQQRAEVSHVLDAPAVEVSTKFRESFHNIRGGAFSEYGKTFATFRGQV